MIRNLQFRDLETLIQYPLDFPFPLLSNGLYCVQKALLDHDKVVGAAFLRLTCEATLILDPKLNDLTKAALISESFKELKAEATEKYGLDQVHVFIVPESNVKYAEFLKKHFGFQETIGIPLVYTKEN